MFEKLLATISRALDGAGIPYMVIGGQAVLLYGEPRLTRDIDITLGASLDRLGEVVALAKEIGLKVLVDPESFTRDTMVLPCQDPVSGIRIDLIFSDSAYEREALRRAREIVTDEARVRFAAPEDVVIHKVVAGRARDLDDVRSILIRNPGVDEAWICHWLGELQEIVEEPLLERYEGIRESD
jgi:hypothetical protein